ncbi:replication-relaxation family protein [Streptomyces flaveolus]|uniref:replication-relaxation family protein n=1 Tax=Streptomyces flaveolus TaxID=67297 RepID=UPI0036F7CC58
MAGKRKENEAGSSNDLRADVLRVLGVIKVATADQIQRLSSPHLTYRHTLKPTAAKRKEARTASHRAAVNDLRRHGLAVDGGRTRGGEETRLLTKDGLAAAAIDLDREIEEMGGMPKSAGRSGASHPMTVNETVIALIRPKPNLNKVMREPAEAVAAARAAVDASDGLGTLASYATEVALPVKGTWKNPVIGSARADVVLTAPEAGVPLLFIEVDNCTEEAVLIAQKFDKYARFFQRQEKDTDGIEKPMWRTRWSAPPSDEYERVHPPVLLVFHQAGQRSAKNQMARVADLTRHHWQGRWHPEGGYHPTTAASRSWRPRWRSCANMARPGPPSGASAATTASRCWTRSAMPAGTPTSPAAARPPGKNSAAVQSGKPHSGRPRRPVCADCGQKFTDARWEAIDTRDWSKRQSHPHLCEDCQDRAVAAEQQADADERERQEQERLRQEAEEQAAAQKAGGWLSRFRT